MTHHANALRYAVRVRVMLRYFGQFCLVLSALTLVPLLVSLLAGESDLTPRYALVTGGVAVLGVLLARLRAPADLQVNESMVLAAGIFLFTPLLMAYPFMASGLSCIDAVFEAISGSTTTGLSTLGTVEGTSATFRFARAWMQWYGGLGIVVFSLALVVAPGGVAKRLALTEAESDDLLGGTLAHARRVLMIYSVLTGSGFVGLWLLGLPPFEAVLYTMAAVSTGGFAPHDSSLAALSTWPLQALVTLLCLLGAVPFPVFYGLWRPLRHSATSLLQLRALLMSTALVTVLLGAGLWATPATAALDVRRHAPLLALSAHTTAGFASFPVATLAPASKLLLIFAMVIGGGVGSTAGGFKLLRLLIVLRLLATLVVRTSLPRQAVFAPRLAGQRLQAEETQEALLLIVLFIMLISLSWVPFVMAGYHPLDALFEVVSATATVGLSTGLTNPDLSVWLKAVLCLDMLLGRVEIIAWLVLVYPGTWIGRRRRRG